MKPNPTTPKTPWTKSDSAIRKAGVRPRSLPNPIRKQLLFSQVVLDEVKFCDTYVWQFPGVKYISITCLIEIQNIKNVLT